MYNLKKRFNPAAKSSQLFYYVIFKKKTQYQAKGSWICRESELTQYNSGYTTLYPFYLFAKPDSNT